jgi:RimJ/RimL family protein N-acetyltransferase
MDVPDPMPLDETVVLASRDGRALPARRLRGADRAALQAFDRELGAATRARFLPHAYDDLTLERLLRRSEAGDDLLLGLFDPASAAARIVGYFFLWYFRERVPLLGVGLLDSFQGLGLGGAMVRFLIEQARTGGCEGVELTTLPENGRAFALYEKCGFRHYADVPNLDGSGRTIVERAMFYEIKPGARPLDKPHAPPVT